MALLRVVQTVFSIAAVYLLVEGLNFALAEPPAILPLMLGALRASAATTAILALWLAGRWPLTAALGVIVSGLGCLLFLPVSVSGVILSSSLFWAGVWLWWARPGSLPSQG